MTPTPVTVIPMHMLSRGPDHIRGTGIAFIMTKYADPSGSRWFAKDGSIGHEMMTSSPEMLQALFGPRAKEVADEVITMRDVYGKDAMGYPAPTGEKKTNYDYHEIRRMAKKDNLFGRYGKILIHPVVMLWNAPNNWQSLLTETLHHLKVTPDSNTVVTVGASDQFMAKDFLGGDYDNALDQHVAKSQLANSERMEMLAKYHTATGKQKDYLGKMLGVSSGGPSLGSMPDWNRQAISQGIGPYVGKYGEKAIPLNFKQFLENQEGDK